MPEVADAFPFLTVPAVRDDIVIPQGGFVKPTMGSIRERARKDGTTGYTAQIILKRKGKPTYREAATFDRRTQAASWLKSREAELKTEGGIERAKVRGMTVADAIDRYIADSRRDIGRTKSQVLSAIKRYDLGEIEAGDVGSTDIVRFVQDLTATGVKPQTVQNYMSHLSAVFAVAKPMWGIPLSREAMKDAFAVTKRMGLTGKSEKRDRRPTIAEMNKLMDYFTAQEARHPGMAPMARIVPFALFSTRRLGEIVRITWEDFDGTRVLVRDMKHPGEKIGNDQWVDVPEEAILFMPVGGAQPAHFEDERPGNPGDRGGAETRIFPYSEEAIGANFTRACKLLEIEDLHFHDLRHEGVSRLFELGWTIPRAATVSGHRSWQSLQRYSHLRQTGDKWKDWKWLPKAQTPA
jgi:integrase